MKTNSNLLTLRIPNELKHNIQVAAEKQGVSMNQLALYLLTKEIEEMQTYNYLEKYWNNKNSDKIKNDYDSILRKVEKKKTIPSWDKL